MTTQSAPTARRGNSLPILIFIGIALGMITLMFLGRDPFRDLLINPLINMLVLLNIVTFGNFGLAIILFTVILRVVTIPFTIRQLESTRAMQAAQPEMQEIQKKYKDPKRRQEEMIKLYREHNINPLGCLVPTIIQFGVFFALYRALAHLVGGSPESLVSLSQRLYPFGVLQGEIPLNQHFLWMNMGEADTTLVLPIIVGLTTYIQQRLSITPNASPQMQQQQQMMTWLLPMMLVFITLSLPSGVGVYWVISNIFSLFASYYVYGRRILTWRQLLPVPIDAPAPTASPRKERTSDKPDIEGEATESDPDAEPDPDEPAQREARTHGKRRGKRKKRG
ncbi:MAG TPA: YidC/Oxa1 family membrane protein insertase [Dehalococcoidia bacterium]|nr:YidC/Oxa1 family membrane protein insertase [Dehalococcoidia bacterium]